MSIREAPFMVGVRSLHQGFENLDSFFLLEFFVLERIDSGAINSLAKEGPTIYFSSLFCFFFDGFP
jgi:hypothetical protein